MALSKDLVIQEFQKGIGISPSAGFEEIRYLDVSSNYGSVQLNLKPTASTPFTGLVMSYVITAEVAAGAWAVTDDGKLYTSNEGEDWLHLSASSAPSEFLDIVEWEGYLLNFSRNDLRLYNMNTVSWYNTGSAWKTLTPTSPYRTALVSQNGNVYFSNGRYIGSIQKIGSTFTPGTGSTYNFNLQALDLPSGYKIKTIVEYGRYLAIGTYKGQSGELPEQRVADIFFWDTFSSSFETNVIRLNEFGIHQMIVKDNLLYIVAGREGTVYISNGTSVEKLRSLPRHITHTVNNKYLHFYPKAIAVHKEKVYFGVSAGTSSADLDGIGVWSIDSKGKLVFEDRMSAGNTNGLNTKIGALIVSGTDRYYFSWKNGSSYGSDYIHSTNYYTSYSAYCIAPIYIVGTSLNKETIEQLEIVLEKPLATGEGVRVSYRPDRTTAFTGTKTFDFATYGARQHINMPFPATDLVTFQPKIEVTGTSSTPVIKEIRFR